jgi:hypothetical protein
MKNTPKDRYDIKKQQLIFMIISAVISILLLIMPFGFIGVISQIFNIFTTIIHETGHAVAGLISGRTNISIEVDILTTAGLTTSYGSDTNIFVISAGYLGASLLGGILLIFSAYKKSSKLILKVLGGFLLLISFFFMLGQWATFAVTLIFAVGFVVISFIKDVRFSFFAVNFLAIQLIVNAFADIITLIRISFGAPSTGGVSDAYHMAQATFGTEWLWAIIYLLISILIFFISFKINRKIISQS